MNIAYYMALFDRGTELLTEPLLDRVSADHGKSMTVVAGRVFIEYKKELFEGDVWQLFGGFSRIDSGGMTMTMRLICRNALRARCDIQGSYTSLKTRRRLALDDGVLVGLEGFLIDGLVDRFPN